MATVTSDRELVRSLKGAGIKAKRWRNTGSYVPPADVNFKGVLRIHFDLRP